ncbi:hypothetical protein [uncultured Streptomyces sp.]|uniref:hypothetical protein n=1 Tax=uncultured Streptomyces sp. TaxID=174707 RepID=UPI002618D29E|nr:hypothetical protein [uncultured Streptomyces sp.]
MRVRRLVLGLYGDPAEIAWARETVRAAVAGQPVRLVREELRTGAATAEQYEELPVQWAAEHPGQEPGARGAVELRVGVVCTPRVARRLRRAVPDALCPADGAAHVCRVPWALG